MSIRALEKTVVEKRSIAYLWFNDFAGVVIKTPARTLVIDPVMVDPKQFSRVDILLITHEHFDHLDTRIVREIYKETKCMVIADTTSFRRLRPFISPRDIREAKIGEVITIEEITINVEECNHPPALTPITFVITSEDGIRVFHTADSLPFPRMETIGKQFEPDIAFCTVGIAPGASPRTGAEIAMLIKPKLAIPYHGVGVREFARILRTRAPDIKFKIIEKNEVYKYPE